MENSPLPRRTVLLYASGSFANNMSARVVAAWLFYFYAATADAPDLPRRLSVWATGLIITAVNVVQALSNPLIGHWSDCTTSRWGRRLPFVLLATLPWAVFLVLLWTPPSRHTTVTNAVYLVLVLLTFRLFATLSGAPMEALLPEIAPRSADRVRIVIGQVFFGTFGVLVAVMGTGPLVDRFGYPVMAAVVAAAGLLSRSLAVAGIWRHARRDVAPDARGFFRAIRSVFRNEQFLYYLPTYVTLSLGITLMTAALPFFVRAVLLAPPDRVGRTVSLLASAPALCVVLSLPLISVLAAGHSKAWMYSRALLFGALYTPLFFFMGYVPGVPRLLQAWLFLVPAGAALAAVLVFPNALMADVIDYDALRAGARREGLYYGTQNVVESVVVALHAAILAGLLSLGGSAADPLGIRLVGPVAGACMLLGYLAFRRYSLPDSVTPDTLARSGTSRSAGGKR